MRTKMARPREFEPEEALERAMHQFWSKGYHDTSIRDLVDRTGVNYYGLYGTFENKHGLFLAALDHYRETVTAKILGELQGTGPVRKAIERTFERVLELMQTPDGRVGCLMCNTATELGSQDPQAAAKVRSHMALLQSAFRKRLDVAVASGELPGNADSEGLAEFMATTLYSIGLLARSGQDDDYVRRHIQSALRTLG
jgi:TetR/AcrR family transcriptional repressor of nem operon